MRTHYDAVIVGGRVAGAATAMLLAREGAEVLLVERGPVGRDTLSTHALMRGAVVQLDRWGLLDRVASVTPAVTHTTFRYPSGDVDLDMQPLYAPRRTVLDPIMIEAAREAGATVCHETRLVDVARAPSGRVTGVEVAGRIDGRVSADIVIGADGLRSTVARLVEAPVMRHGTAANATIVAYVDGAELSPSTYHWAYGTEAVTGVIPTNDGLHCLFTSLPSDDFRRRRYGDVPETFRRLMNDVDPAVAAAISDARMVGRYRSTPGHVGQFRQAGGPGWALVGDAGYFKDPGAAHGISDAFRDAELLARAIVDGTPAAYGERRDALSDGLFRVLERLVAFDWTLDELPAVHLDLIDAMSTELRDFMKLIEPDTSRIAA